MKVIIDLDADVDLVEVSEEVLGIIKPEYHDIAQQEADKEVEAKNHALLLDTKMTDIDVLKDQIKEKGEIPVDK